MARLSNYIGEEKNTGGYQETLWLGLRIYRGLFLNLFGRRAPLFCGHKLTYKCNLRCKMCPFWQRPSEDSSIEKEVEELSQRVDPKEQHFIIAYDFGNQDDPHGFLGGNLYHIVRKRGKAT